MIDLTHTYANELKGCYESLLPETLAEPSLLMFNQVLATELGLSDDFANEPEAIGLFSGNRLPSNSRPIAQVYAGHQFGAFSPQLGDGRALLIGELIDQTGVRRDIQLKGSGRTPFSRGGDGKAALGPVLREYLISEAMFALGVPTTRALAVTVGTDTVYRDGLKPRAVLTRVALSHIRVGTFEYFSSQQEWSKLEALVDYSLRRHYPDAICDSDPSLDLFKCVIERQADLISQWMALGFIHGVMNTDNMTISGETIDYGPCAFMDRYDPQTVFSSIDEYGRYAYGNQTKIGKWNLAMLAKALLPISSVPESKKIDAFVEALDQYDLLYEEYYFQRMARKLGLSSGVGYERTLIDSFLILLSEQKADFTNAFRCLSDVLRGDFAFFDEVFESDPVKAKEWVIKWKEYIGREGVGLPQVADEMDACNPIYIPRNHLVEEALNLAVSKRDLSTFDSLFDIVSRPFDDVGAVARKYRMPAPMNAPPHVTFCGT
jgi:uncharacterized protein YdiU (UPF0061 family)